MVQNARVIWREFTGFFTGVDKSHGPAHATSTAVTFIAHQKSLLRAASNSEQTAYGIKKITKEFSPCQIYD